MQRHRLEGAVFLTRQFPHPFGRLAAENRFSAARADDSRNILDQHKFAVNLKDFIDKFLLPIRRTANMTLEHFYLRSENAIHSSGSGSYSVMIRAISVSTYET